MALATAHVERLRPKMPANYGKSREFQLPIPNILPPDEGLVEEHQDEDITNSTEPMETSNHSQGEMALSPIGQSSNEDQNEENMGISNDVPFNEEHVDPSISNMQIKEESIDLNEINENELDAILYQGQKDDLEVNEERESNRETQVWFGVYDDDVEIEVGAPMPQPITVLYRVKENNVFSGNVPFRQFVSFLIICRLIVDQILIILFSCFQKKDNGNLGFLIEKDEGNFEVRLSNNAVKILTTWNAEKRQSLLIDKLFIEYLLVAMLGIEKIKESNFDAKILDLVKGKYTSNSQTRANYY